MRKISLKYSWLILLVFPLVSFGQHTSKTFGDVKKIADELKNIKGVAYKYDMKASYPNGQEDHLSGEVFVDENNQLLYNNSAAATMIYAQKWYYKADHRKKTVTVIDLDKAYSACDKKKMSDMVFKNGALITFIDSVVLKSATIKKYENANDTVKVELTFPKQAQLRDISMVYDVKSKMFVSYRISVFHATGAEDEGVLQVISCSGFRKPDDIQKYKQDNFFTIKSGKVVLKKFNKYKLFAKQ